jgi:AICAR transformylase/IMP cyclohydrolase PurH
MSLTPEEESAREQLRIEAERRADNYAAAVAEYQKKKPKPHCARRSKKKRRKKRHLRRGDRQHRRAAARCRIFVSDELCGQSPAAPAFATAACSRRTMAGCVK